MTLSITRQEATGQSAVLVLQGVLDIASARRLRAVISATVARRPAPRRIVVDLGGVDFVDDTGVGTLVVANRICGQLGIDLAIRRPSSLIRRLLSMPRTGVGR